MRGSVHVSEEELAGWFAGRLPDAWFSGPPEVSSDREEILVVGTLSEPELTKDAAPEAVGAARAARIDGFREDTRGQRIVKPSQDRSGREYTRRPVTRGPAGARWT